MHRSEKGNYVWDGAPAYKNDRLAEYQAMLKERGITNPEHIKILLAGMIQENGAISEDVDGDNGCSIGLAQRNVCNFGYSAKRFRQVYPAWKDYRTQLTWLADDVAQRYQMYGGDIFRTVVHHNSPLAASQNKDSCRYLNRGSRKVWSCYYRDEVSSRLDYLKIL